MKNISIILMTLISFTTLSTSAYAVNQKDMKCIKNSVWIANTTGQKKTFI